MALDFVDAKEAYNWNAAFVILTMAVCREALAHAGLPMNEETAPRTACLIGSAINGADAFRTAMLNFQEKGPLKISPYLLPNLCANLPSGKAGMLLGFTGPVFSPQGACASGNHAIGIGARMIRDGDCDFVLAGGVDTPILPEIIHGFANMNATDQGPPGGSGLCRPRPGLPSLQHRPARLRPLRRGGRRRARGRGDARPLRAHGAGRGPGGRLDLRRLSFHQARTRKRSSGRSGRRSPTRGSRRRTSSTSTPTAPPRRKGIRSRSTACGRSSGRHLEKIPLSSNKSQIGHTLGAAAAIEDALTIEGMQRGIILPTINHLPDPRFADIDCVPDTARRQPHELALSNAFGFGGTNCCIIFRGVAA